MGEIVSLNKIRKARAKLERTSQAAENRLRFGRTKVERLEQCDENDRIRSSLDGSRLDPES